MSTYFENFPKVLYQFGDSEEPVLFQQLTKYVDLIDQVREDVSTYIEYEIRDFDRPDTLSHRLYGKAEYDWTFFLMNDRLREVGWPLTVQDLYDHAQNHLFSNYTCLVNIDRSDSDTIRSLASIYPVGQSVLVGEAPATVIKKNLNVGEITVSADQDITTETLLSYSDGSNSQSLTNTVYEYEGTHHYEDEDGEWIDYFFDTSTTAVPVTNLEYLVSQNDQAKRIRVIKKENIEKVVGEFKRQLER